MAIAVSGGGDSIAALVAAAAWARMATRPLVVLSVDHQLQPASGRWRDFVGEAAAGLGADFRPLAWTESKPDTGLAAAARTARHRLLADAARDVGACVLITGHTASDAAENALLGQGPLREWSPSPVWPQGRGVFLLRPLLGWFRQDVRNALTSAGVAYIDDPANEDLRHPRVRARRTAAEPGDLPAPPSTTALTDTVRFLPGGGLGIERAGLTQADPAAARRVLAAALTSAGGAERPAKAAGVERLLERLREPRPVTATLAGVRLVADHEVLMVREAGDRRRAGAAPLILNRGEHAVWDGRYEVESFEAGLTVDILRGHARQLSRAERAALAALPVALRPGLPVILDREGPTCPILAQASSRARLTDLVPARFLGACGAIAQESELAQGAHGIREPSVLCSTPVTE